VVSRTGGLALAVAAFALLVAAPAHAVAPANDTVAGAFTIPDGPYPAAGATVPDITDATAAGDPPTPSCQTTVSRSVWYRWTPSQTGFYKVSTGSDEGSASTVDDTVLAVYTSTGGDAGPFTEVPTTADTDGCDDDSATVESLQSTLASKFTAGTTYYIVIWQYDTPPPDAGNTAVQPVVKIAPGPPAEDTAGGATALSLDRPLEVDDTSAHNDYQLPPASPCFGPGQTTTTAAGRDSVYTFTAPAGGSFEFRVSTLNSPLQNLVVYLAPSPPPGPAPATVACTQAFNRQNSSSAYSGEVAADVTLTAGQQIYIFVDRSGTVPEPGGLLHLEAFAVGPQETEPNDTPATADPLSCGIRGAVNPAADTDFHSLGTPTTGSRVFAMADGLGAGPGDDLDMRLNSATDTLEYDDLDTDVPFGGRAPVLAGPFATGTPLFLQVDGFGAAPSSIVFPYHVYAVVQPPSSSASPEGEPNGTLGGATIAASNYFSGALAGPAPSSDVDLYAFDAGAGDRIFVALDGDPMRDNTPVDTQIQLLDAAGNVELSVDGSASDVVLDNANPAGLFETVPAFPAEAFSWRSVSSGLHYVRVQSAATDAAGVGDYLLSISRNCFIGGGGVANPSISTTSLPDATVGTPYNQAVEAANAVGGGEFSLVSGNLPDGLHLATDGHIAGTPTVAGTSDFTVQVKDSRDLTATRALSIVTHAGPPGSGSGADTKAPTASHLVARKHGKLFRFRLSEAARVEITIAQLLPGRKVRRKCVRQTRKNRHAKRCVRALRKGALRFSGHAGSNSRAFSGKLRGRRLKPGLYQATLIATDAAGNRSKPVKVRFRVVRRRGNRRAFGRARLSSGARCDAPPSPWEFCS
jgi:hypothetical protein